MKKETKEKLKAFLDKAVKFFTETETIYVEDKNGDYTAVRTEAFDKLDQEIKSFINDINNSLEGLEESQKQEIKEAISMLEDMDFSKVDSSAISKILEEAQKEIEDSKSLRMGEVNKPDKGGYYAIVSRVTDPKDLGNPERKTGAGMFPRDDELVEQFVGDYTKTDTTVEIFKKALEKIQEVEKETNGKNNEELRKKVIDTLKKNKTKVIDSAVNNSINKPKGTKIKQVHRNKGLKRIVAVAMALTIAASAFALGFSSRPHHLSIPVASIQTIDMNMPQYVDGIVSDIIGDIGILDAQHSGAAKEAGTLNKTEDELNQIGLDKIDKDNPQISASSESSSYTNQLQKLEQEIKQIESDYKDIKNPTNKDWINYQQKIADKNIELLNLNKEIIEQTNLYAESWMDLNDEHIAEGMSDDALVRHESEKYNSSKTIDGNSKKLKEINKQIEEFENKSEFLKNLKGLKQVEDIKDIRNFCRINV